MTVMRLNLGRSPRIVVEECGGNLEVRGWSREETVIEYSDRETDIETVEGSLKISTRSHLSLRVPETSTISIGNVGGNLRLKEVDTALNIENVGGTLMVRRIQALHLGSVGGHLVLRDVDGDFNFQTIGGNVTLRDVRGPLIGETVNGHVVAKTAPAGAKIEQIGGNLVLKTDLKPETSYEFRCDGSAEITVPESADVRFLVDASGTIKADTNFQTVLEGRQRIFMSGSGSSVFKLSAGGSVRIKQRSMYRTEEDMPEGFEDFSEEIEEAMSHLDLQFESIEAQLERIPEHIRGRVERKLDAARRHVIDAQKRASRTVERATRDLSGAPSVYVDFSGSGQPKEPVSEAERMMILQMLEEGKINVKDAQKLLEALEGREG
jgi:hypothetical protein